MAEKIKSVLAKIRGISAEQWRLVGITACVVVILASLFFGILSEYNQNIYRAVSHNYYGELEMDTTTYQIKANEKEQKVKIRNTGRRGRTSKFAYYCESNMYVKTMDDEGTILFSNPDSVNSCILVLQILSPDGSLIYQSKGIKPGYYISQITLHGDLPERENDCKVVVTAFDPETNKLIGIQYSNLSITVGDKSYG